MLLNSLKEKLRLLHQKSGLDDKNLKIASGEDFLVDKPYGFPRVGGKAPTTSCTVYYSVDDSLCSVPLQMDL